ncbi:MAG: Superoxide dismutase [Thermoleophilia bacterium]|nr:Superoxide dismutase [Thermoleophilia bacterium]
MLTSRAFRPCTALVVLATAALLAAGCGDDDDADTGTETTEPDIESAEPEVASARTVELPGERVFPEGIALDEPGRLMFVSSTTDGTIFSGPLDAERLEPLEVGTGGPTQAIGLATGPDAALWVAGGDTGMVWRLDQAGGDVAGAHKAPGSGATFLNDIAVAEDGTAYVTDSMRPVIYRIAPDAEADAPLEAWLDLEGTAIEYGEGFNLNGIEFTPDQEQLLVVQANTGGLFRIPVDGGEPEQVDLGGEALAGGDGLEVDGQRLYVVLGESGDVGVVDLDSDYGSGSVAASITDDGFARPTTVEKSGSQLLVVNSQFDAMESPELPFTVSVVDVE